jgi:hypothetical protein
MASYRKIGNLKGPQGDLGPRGIDGAQGPQGLPGIGAVPADSGIASYLESPSKTRAAALALTAPVDAGLWVGDSLSEGQGEGGITVPWVAGVGSDLGVPWFNTGIRGRASSDIAVTAGALDLGFTVTGGTINANGATGINLTTTGAFRSGSGANSTWTGVATTNAGATFDCTITHVQGSSHYWTVTPTGLTGPLAASSLTFHCTATDNYRNRVWGIWVGRNNFLDGLDPQLIIRDTDLIVRRAISLGQRYVVLGVTNTSSEPRGSANYNTIVAINSVLAARHGDRFFDIRKWLVNLGLTQAGLTATADDLTDIAADVIPRQLRSDGTHLNTSGYMLALRPKVTRLVAAHAFIPGVTPTTEPIPADPTPSLGVSGIISRYHANLITGRPDETIVSWPDQTGAHSLTTIGGTPKLRQAGGKRYVDLGVSANDSASSASWDAPDNAYTVGITVRWAAADTAERRFIGTAGTSGIISLQSTGRVRLWNGAAGLGMATTPSVGWHTIIGVFNGSSSVIYIDGVSVATGSLAAATISGVMNIQGYSALGTLVADAAVLDHAATAGEVATLHAALASSIPA